MFLILYNHKLNGLWNGEVIKQDLKICTWPMFPINDFHIKGKSNIKYPMTDILACLCCLQNSTLIWVQIYSIILTNVVQMTTFNLEFLKYKATCIFKHPNQLQPLIHKQILISEPVWWISQNAEGWCIAAIIILL